MLTAALAFVAGAHAADIEVTDAFARASATPKAASAAAYVSFKNKGAADRLVMVTTQQAAMAHIHESKTVDGVMSMEMVDAVEIGAGGTFEMKPGGFHIMLMGLKAPLVKGGTLKMEMTFERNGKMSIEMPVAGVAAGGAGG